MLRVELAAILILVISLGPIDSSKSSRKGPESPQARKSASPQHKIPRVAYVHTAQVVFFPPCCILRIRTLNPQFPCVCKALAYVLLTLSPSEFPNIVPTKRNSVVATSQSKTSPVLGAGAVATTLSCPKVLRRLS